MDLYKYQTQFRIADARLPSGHYYWLGQFIFDADVQPNVTLARQRIRDYWIQCSLEVVQLYYQRIEHPSGTGPWTQLPAFSTAFGEYPVEGGYSPYQGVYLHHMAGGVQVGYSRLRMPVLSQDLVGDRLHTDLQDHIYFWANFALAEAGVTSREGVLIEEFIPSPRVMEWQYRQGTKRRERVFIQHP